ncbi:putative sulfate transport protein CysZ [Pantoea agglomerans]|uniref:Putative sulfate transport protein CysZ n=1 Tax=Enterobacter agglomerans TaxID=549 RepID=A0A379ACT8_ENTAG|nr:putative sulfate transport protein CysZ [Pantoea agglomerans]
MHYFSQGWKLVRLPGIRRFVVMPLLINIVMLGGAFIWLFYRLGDWIPRLMAHIPDWLQWLSYLLWPLSVIAIVLVFSYFFSTLANLIAAPFCGLLAEQLEGRLTGKPLPDSGWAGMIKDVPRIMKREMQKLGYYLPPRAGTAAALLYSWLWPDRCAGAVVPVQRLDVVHPVLRLPV